MREKHAPPVAAALRAVLEFQFLSLTIDCKQSMGGIRLTASRLASV